jgi:hypothetical protein
MVSIKEMIYDILFRREIKYSITKEGNVNISIMDLYGIGKNCEIENDYLFFKLISYLKFDGGNKYFNEEFYYLPYDFLDFCGDEFENDVEIKSELLRIDRSIKLNKLNIR